MIQESGYKEGRKLSAIWRGIGNHRGKIIEQCRIIFEWIYLLLPCFVWKTNRSTWSDAVKY